jgi:GDP/UDP-N,N'-diacetylbacillosamine 2-epimerase (hydrolysing)
MKYANFLIGNTSSGIIEAASFNKYVINVGDRQKGRVQSENVKNIPFCQHKLYEKYQEVSTLGNFNGENKYYGSDVVGKIIEKILIYERN